MGNQLIPQFITKGYFRIYTGAADKFTTSIESVGIDLRSVVFAQELASPIALAKCSLMDKLIEKKKPHLTSPSAIRFRFQSREVLLSDGKRPSTHI